MSIKYVHQNRTNLVKEGKLSVYDFLSYNEGIVEIGRKQILVKKDIDLDDGIIEYSIVGEVIEQLKEKDENGNSVSLIKKIAKEEQEKIKTEFSQLVKEETVNRIYGIYFI